MTRGGTWTNALLFQLAWICAVGGAARGWWWAGPLATIAFALHALRYGGRPRSDLRLALIAATGGFALDTFWVQSGFLSYAAALPWQGAAPIWIVALWVNFALSLNHSLAWLLHRPLIAALLGAIGSPLSYFFAAHTWHALTIAAPAMPTLAAIGAAWAVVTPLLCGFAVRLAASRKDASDLLVLTAMVA